jgi:hypothetical protein
LTVVIPDNSKDKGIVGAVVSVIELSTVLFTFQQSKTVQNISDGSTSVSVSTPISNPVVASNIISISLATVSQNSSQLSAILPTFEAILNLSSAVSPIVETTMLKHNCSIGLSKSFGTLCHSSHVWINVTCTGNDSHCASELSSISACLCGTRLDRQHNCQH